MLKDLVIHNRSYRRFDEKTFITYDQVVSLIDLARLAPSAGNLQPLRYFISVSAPTNEKIFPHLFWGGDTQNSFAPIIGERPTAYILVLEDTHVSRLSTHDQGIAAQTILLGAVEMGFGGCIIKSMDRDALEKVIEFGEDMDLKLIIALGKPLDAVLPEGSTDTKGVKIHKKTLKEILLN